MTTHDIGGPDPLDARTYSQNDEGEDIIPNIERGCKYLKRDNTYFRSEVSPDGVIPVFVKLDPFLPFLEKRFRGYREFDGLSYELAITGKGAAEGMVETDPAGEVWNHIDRLAASGDATHAAAVPQYDAEDLMMFIGGSHYDTPADFIEEVRQMGLSKGVNLPNKIEKMPRVIPGVTRLWLIHPKAIEREVPVVDGDGEEDATEVQLVPGVIGYAYLTRIAHTRDAVGDVPGWVSEAAAAGRLDIVEIGQYVPEDDARHPKQSGIDYDEQAELVVLEDPESDAKVHIFEAGEVSVLAEAAAEGEAGEADALCNRAGFSAEQYDDVRTTPLYTLADAEGFDLCGNCSSLLADRLAEAGEEIECPVEGCDRVFGSERARRAHVGRAHDDTEEEP